MSCYGLINNLDENLFFHNLSFNFRLDTTPIKSKTNAKNIEIDNFNLSFKKEKFI